MILSDGEIRSTAVPAMRTVAGRPQSCKRVSRSNAPGLNPHWRRKQAIEQARERRLGDSRSNHVRA